MAFYLELKRSVLVLRNYYSKIWENTGITTDAESVDDTKTLPVIEGERRKAKGERREGERKKEIDQDEKEEKIDQTIHIHGSKKSSSQHFIRKRESDPDVGRFSESS